MKFDDLPTEIIIHICTFNLDFKQLCSVSQRFNKIINIAKEYINNIILTQYLQSYKNKTIDCVFKQAIRHNNITIVQLLLDADLHPQCVESSMCVAIHFNHIEILVLLIQNTDLDADIYSAVLSRACSHNVTKIVNMMLKFIKISDYTCPLVNATINYNIEIIALLADYVCDNDYDFAMEHIAMVKSNNIEREIETYKLLLPRTCADTINETFYSVVHRNNKPIVSLLLPYITLDALEYQNILLHAIKNNNKSLVTILLTNIHAHVSIDNNINLITAGQKNYKTIIQMLLLHPNINLNIPNFFIFTYAAGCVYTILTELLLADGRADPCANCNEALLNACILQNKKIALLLIADSRVDTKDVNIFENQEKYNIITYIQ